MSHDMHRQDRDKEINDRKTGMVCYDSLVGEGIYKIENEP
jgi:hypothetical protein